MPADSYLTAPSDRLQRAITRPAWPLGLWLTQAVIPSAVLANAGIQLVCGPALSGLIQILTLLCGLWLAVVLVVALTGRGRGWLITHRYQVTAIILSGGLTLAIGGESMVRLLGTTDGDGAFRFRHTTLRPYRLPIKAMRAALKRYNETQTSVSVYHPEIGWLPHPHFTTGDGVFSHNSASVRTDSIDHEYEPSPPPDTLRICIFGDSFTYGVANHYQDTIGAMLETKLKARGIKTEVLNFGVSGYGMDQAYLRWKKQGFRFAPQFVIFFCQLENIWRNLNFYLPLRYPGTDLPFTKPRYVLEGDSVRLLNVPCLSPEDSVETLANIDQWSLALYENSYKARDYQWHLWNVSKLLSYVETKATRRLEMSRHARDAEDLCLAIIEMFHEDVVSSGARFLVVHVPLRDELATLRQLGIRLHEPLLKKIAAIGQFVPTADEFVRRTRTSSTDRLFDHTDHYSGLANDIIADVAAREILEDLPRRATRQTSLGSDGLSPPGSGRADFALDVVRFSTHRTR
jgi:hypothetical protein